MAVDYSTTVLTERLQIVINNIDAGSTNGFMRLFNSAATTLASFQLSRPCGVASNGVLSFSGLSLIDPAAAATGVATSARIEDGDGNIIIHGLVVDGPAGATDIFLTPAGAITAGQTVAITAATITGN